MNFIGKHLNLIGILLLTAFVGTAAGLYYDVPSRFQDLAGKDRGSQPHTCALHSDSASSKSADTATPPCGMEHAPSSGIKAGQNHSCGMASAPVSQDKVGHEQGGEKGALSHGCCAEKAAKPAMALRLPPGHPPVPGWTVSETQESSPVSSNSPAHPIRN